jgi:hypothetical protein
VAVKAGVVVTYVLVVAAVVVVVVVVFAVVVVVVVNAEKSFGEVIGDLCKFELNQKQQKSFKISKIF